MWRWRLSRWWLNHGGDNGLGYFSSAWIRRWRRISHEILGTLSDIIHRLTDGLSQHFRRSLNRRFRQECRISDHVTNEGCAQAYGA